MLSLATSPQPLLAEVLPIPPLALTGRVPPNGSLVTLDTSSAHAELTLWPEYHNGEEDLSHLHGFDLLL